MTLAPQSTTIVNNTSTGPRAVSRGALSGAAISGVFGVVWAVSAASALPGGASTVIRAAAVAAGVTIVVASALLWRSAARAVRSRPSAQARHGSSSMFSSPRYLAVVAIQVLMIGGGNAVLGAAGQREYVIAWVATVVGLHFFAFGRLFWTGFYWLGAALVAAGVAGATAGLAGGGPDAIRATTGLIAAATLIGAGGWTVVSARAGRSHDSQASNVIVA